HAAKLAAAVIRAMFLTGAEVARMSLFRVSLRTGGASVMTHQALAGKAVAPQVTTKQANNTSIQLAAEQQTRQPEAAVSKETAPNSMSTADGCWILRGSRSRMPGFIFSTATPSSGPRSSVPG